MQVDPIKPTFKAPGSKRLKLEHENPVPNFAFNFNLRRYKEAQEQQMNQNMYAQLLPAALPAPGMETTQGMGVGGGYPVPPGMMGGPQGYMQPGMGGGY